MTDSNRQSVADSTGLPVALLSASTIWVVSTMISRIAQRTSRTPPLLTRSVPSSRQSVSVNTSLAFEATCCGPTKTPPDALCSSRAGAGARFQPGGKNPACGTVKISTRPGWLCPVRQVGVRRSGVRAEQSSTLPGKHGTPCGLACTQVPLAEASRRE